MKIDGQTEIYGILGDPIKQVATPELMNAIYKEKGENKVLLPFHVNQNALASAINGLKKIQNFKGAVITMPHKTAIVKYLDETTEEVKRIGACNVIKRTPEGTIKGTLLDGKGFIQGLKTHHYTVEAKTIFLLGCGGTAAAIAFALCENNIKKLSIFNRTKSKAIQLIAKLKAHYPSIEIVFSDNISNETDILINATSVGMKENDRPLLSLANLDFRTLVADVIISPEMTCTLKDATQQGCKIHKGIAMLEGQIKLMNEFMN